MTLTKAINREMAEELVGGEEGREEWRPERVETTPSVRPMQMECRKEIIEGTEESTKLTTGSKVVKVTLIPLKICQRKF